MRRSATQEQPLVIVVCLLVRLLLKSVWLGLLFLRSVSLFLLLVFPWVTGVWYFFAVCLAQQQLAVRNIQILCACCPDSLWYSCHRNNARQQTVLQACAYLLPAWVGVYECKVPVLDFLCSQKLLKPSKMLTRWVLLQKWTCYPLSMNIEVTSAHETCSK